MEFYVFIKNVGDRYILPRVSLSSSDGSNVTSQISQYYFDVSSQIDPLSVKGNSANADAFVTSIATEIANGKVYNFGSNSSIDNLDVYVAKIIVKLRDDITVDATTAINETFNINISFMADIQYDSNDILSVYQKENQSTSAWTKFGYNATLSAQATKVENKSLEELKSKLENADEKGNANITFGDGVTADVYSEKTIIYKDIDLVNVDIATGEIIGRLSDLNYPFEWYGREISLPVGTILASGRTLTQTESFTVDVYTYFPAVYVRRWVVGDVQWLSISDKDFSGAVKINEYYLATCEATIFNPDKSVAQNSYGIVTRSYINTGAPLVSGNASYWTKYYGYGTATGYTNSTTQSQMLAWASNLTKAWKEAQVGQSYKYAKTAQGENYTKYVYNILYLVKYANNNSQSMVGGGNVNTYSLYNNTDYQVTSVDGTTTISTKENSNYAYYEAEKASGTIGCYSGNGSAYGMSYGYEVEYTHGSDIKGIYANQFLTYNTGKKRFLCDGYVGSNNYTSVACLGVLNPWGNVWTWVFGTAVLSDSENMWAYAKFEDYDYKNSNYYLSSNSNGFASNNTLLADTYGYVRMTYNLPSTDGNYNYLGTSQIDSGNGMQSLVGMQTSKSTKNNGLCDYYYVNNSTAYVFGVFCGGYVGSGSGAGAFYFAVGYSLSNTYVTLGFRPSLTS